MITANDRINHEPEMTGLYLAYRDRLHGAMIAAVRYALCAK